MTLSIVTAVYNRADTIGDALRSLQRQTLTDFEHVVQDGGSSDGTLDIIAQNADPRIFLQSAADGGIYDALNRGIARARGDIVGLLHSDDLLADDTVLSRVAKVFEDPLVDGVYGDLEYVAKDDPTRVIRYWRAGAYHPGLLSRGWMPPHPTLFLRRAVFETHGMYDTGFRIAADYEAILRWLVKGDVRLAYIPEVLVRMRVGGESNKSLDRVLRKSREDLRAIRRHGVGGLGVLAAKNLGKLSQFVRRDRNLE
jgi:glycosyltransferase